MKRISAVIFLVSLLVSCSTPALAPTATSLPDLTSTPGPIAQTRPALTDPAQPIEVQAGEMITIILDSNPSTGYHWEVVGKLEGVEFISTEYTADEPVAPGSGGVDVWTFKAINAGETQITLGYYPPTNDPVDPDITTTFTVIVR